MARDRGLEALVEAELGERASLTRKAMFGGIAYLVDGHLLCGASNRGLMIRLGKGRDAWALEHEGVTPMMGSRPMPGWIWADETVYGDDNLRRKLFAASLDFLATLPPKTV